MRGARAAVVSSAHAEVMMCKLLPPIAAVALFTGITTPPRTTHARGAPTAGEARTELEAARQEFGMPALADPNRIAKLVLVVLGAAALGAALAFHPFAARGSVELPKIVITYTVAGALIAIVVAPIPAMGFAIFGIGGLMRFRTQLGAAKETGRVILSTLIGLLCGLEFWMAAIVGTAMVWALMWVLESRVHLRMVVRGVDAARIAETADGYSKALRGLRCRFGPPRKNPGKGQVSFNLQIPRTMTAEQIESDLGASIPEALRGTIDWPED
jgi:hypothetical protein